jgi:hypothetical protein
MKRVTRREMLKVSAAIGLGGLWGRSPRRLWGGTLPLGWGPAGWAGSRRTG